MEWEGVGRSVEAGMFRELAAVVMHSDKWKECVGEKVRVLKVGRRSGLIARDRTIWRVRS